MMLDVLDVDDPYDDDAVVPHLHWEDCPDREARLVRNQHGLVTYTKSGPMMVGDVAKYWCEFILRKPLERKYGHG